MEENQKYHAKQDANQIKKDHGKKDPIVKIDQKPKFEEKKPAASKPEKTYYSKNCVVCQFDFQSGERVGVLSCGHTFHPECIKTWLNRSKTCPLCRAQNVFLAKIYDTKEVVPGYVAPKIEQKKIPAPKKVLEKVELPECSICLIDIQAVNCKTLKCGHKYHKACIDDWLSRSKTCPYCRATDI